MKNKIITTRKFEERFRIVIKKNPRYKLMIKSTLDLLITNPADTILRLHRLKGKMRNFFSISVDNDLRIIFIEKQGVYKLFDIGTHKEVYY